MLVRWAEVRISEDRMEIKMLAIALAVEVLSNNAIEDEGAVKMLEARWWMLPTAIWVAEEGVLSVTAATMVGGEHIRRILE